jgi:hypothetical protein
VSKDGKVDPSVVRGPVQGLADLADFLRPEPERTGSFMRGIVIGALVGAAIAGSAIWQRRHARQDTDTGGQRGP